MRIGSHLGFAALIGSILVSCASPPISDPPESDESRIRVVASLSPLAFAVDKVCGDRCTVGVLLPANRDAHDYEPSPKVLQALDRAELWVRTGSVHIPLETRVERHWVDGEQRSQIRLSSDGPAEGHAWLDPAAMSRFADRLADRLASMRPDWAAEFRERAGRFIGEIDALTEEIRRQVSAAEVDEIWVSHPAWGAFCKPWNLKQVALEADGKEPSPKRLVALIDRARSAEVRWFLTVRGEASPAAEVFARETGATAVPIDPLAYDWFETMRGISAALSGTGDDR